MYPHKYRYLWKIKELHEQYGTRPLSFENVHTRNRYHLLPSFIHDRNLKRKQVWKFTRIGPIIRINPIHIHINDPDFYTKIYASAPHKRDRCSWFMHSRSKGIYGSMFEAIGHDFHKSRRGPVSSFFSKRSVHALEPLIVAKVSKLIDRFNSEVGKVVNISNAMAGLTMDIISGYSFGESMDSLERKDYKKEWLGLLHDGAQIRPLGRHFPWLISWLLDLPPQLVEKFSPRAALMNAYTLR